MARILFTYILTPLIFASVLSYFIYPVATEAYFGFWNGLILGGIHGGCVIPSWIWSMVDEARQIKATNAGGWYGFCWWASAIISVGSLVINPIYHYSKIPK